MAITLALYRMQSRSYPTSACGHVAPFQNALPIFRANWLVHAWNNERNCMPRAGMKACKRKLGCTMWCTISEAAPVWLQQESPSTSPRACANCAAAQSHCIEMLPKGRSLPLSGLLGPSQTEAAASPPQAPALKS